MTQLAKYHGRSPRYVLNTEDNNLIRYSGSARVPWEERTEVRNISLTGLSFLAPADLSPMIGEIIKIQFIVPGGKQMACYAIVIRIDQENSYENQIAVHFYKLDRVQRINLLQGLSEKQQSQKSTRAASKSEDSLSTSSKIIAVLGLVFTVLCWTFMMKLYVI